MNDEVVLRFFTVHCPQKKHRWQKGQFLTEVLWSMIAELVKGV